MTALAAVSCYLPDTRVPIEELAGRLELTEREVQVFKRFHGLSEICREPGGTLTDLLSAAVANLTELAGQQHRVRYVIYTSGILDLRVVGKRDGVYVGKGTKSFRLLAQNEAPQIPCDICGKVPAVKICTECRWHGESWWCEECAAKHDTEHQDYFLPVVNSPRVGECGYIG